MLTDLAAALIAAFCSMGQPIDNFYGYAASHNHNFGEVVGSIRFASGHGIVNVWEWDSGVLFVSNAFDNHGQCARKDIHAGVLEVRSSEHP